MEFEGLKHEIGRLEEDSQGLHSQMEDAVRLREIAERQLTESLETIKTEREQKATLRKELSHYMTIGGSVYNSSFNISYDNLKLHDEPSTITEPDNDDLIRGFENGLMKIVEGDEDNKAGGRGESFKPAPSLVDDLLSELNISEIQKLKQQLTQVGDPQRFFVTILQYYMLNQFGVLPDPRLSIQQLNRIFIVQVSQYVSAQKHICA